MDSKIIELGGRKYELNKIPAIAAQKIAFACFKALKDKDIAALPDETVMKLVSYIGAVNASGHVTMLTDENLVAVNVPDAGVLMLLELEMLEYNFGFFFDGSLLKTAGEKFKGLLAKKSQEDADGDS